MSEAYDLSDPIVLPELQARVLGEKWPLEKVGSVYRGSSQLKNHAIDTGDGDLTAIPWLRVNMSRREDKQYSHFTVDIRPTGDTPLRELLFVPHKFTPVAIFNFMKSRESDGLHILTEHDKYLKLAQFAVPEDVELVYSYQGVSAPAQRFAQTTSVQEVAPSSRYL